MYLFLHHARLAQQLIQLRFEKIRGSEANFLRMSSTVLRSFFVPKPINFGFAFYPPNTVKYIVSKFLLKLQTNLVGPTLQTARFISVQGLFYRIIVVFSNLPTNQTTDHPILGNITYSNTYYYLLLDFYG